MPMLDGIRLLEELELENQRVLVRADFDDPLGEGGAAIERDVKGLLPTLSIAQARGARVVIASHASASAQKKSNVSLEPVAERLSSLLGVEIYLPDDAVGDAARKVVQDLRPGQVCLLENLAVHAEEAGNDDSFAHKLARFADVYVNDALRASREPWASVDALPRLLRRRGAGVLLAKELGALARIQERSSDAALAIVSGGADAALELNLLETLLDRKTLILAGGALGLTLLAAVGTELRATPIDPGLLARARALLIRARDAGVELKLPVDLVSAESGSARGSHPVAVTGLVPGSLALGVGPKTLTLFTERLRASKSILVTGPLGLDPNSGTFPEALELFRTVAGNGSHSVVVGAESPGAIERADPELASKMSCVSAGGLATLELLLGRKLAGIEALRGGAT